MTALGSTTRIGLLGATALFVLGCSDGETTLTYASKPGLNLEALDSKMAPCEDFYQFACGGYISRQSPSGAYTYVSTSSPAYFFMADRLERLIVDAATGRPWANTREARLVGNSYNLCMRAPANTEGRAVVKELADRLERAKTMSELAVVLAEYQKRGSSSFFSDGVAPDPMDPDRYVLTFDQMLHSHEPDLQHGPRAPVRGAVFPRSEPSCSARDDARDPERVPSTPRRRSVARSAHTCRGDHEAREYG